jgi:hypothetical protein
MADRIFFFSSSASSLSRLMFSYFAEHFDFELSFLFLLAHTWSETALEVPQQRLALVK